MLTAISETRNLKLHGVSNHKAGRKPTRITPVGHFVVKTKLFSSYRGSLPGTKLFINLCSSDLAPLPPPLRRGLCEAKDDLFDPSLVYPQIMENKWEIPILTSPEFRDVKDKKGNHSFVIDCIIHKKPMKWSLQNADLKAILIEWCFDAIEFKIQDVIIDRETMALPKRDYMGDLQDMEVDFEQIEIEKKELQQLADNLVNGGNDDPSNILVAKRAADDETMDIDEKLPDLLGIINPTGINKKPLIEEIGDMKISADSDLKKVPSKGITEVQEVRVSDDNRRKKKLNFAITVTKLSDRDTRENYKLLIKVDSELRSGSDYKVHYNTKLNLLVISTTNDTQYDVSKSTVEFPLPTYIKGDSIRTFYTSKNHELCIYII